MTVLVVGIAVYVGVVQTRSRERAQQALLLTQIAELVGKDQYGAAFDLARPLSLDQAGARYAVRKSRAGFR